MSRQEDINRIIDALATRGLECDAGTAEMLWMDYSQGLHAVSWYDVPTPEEICNKLVGDIHAKAPEPISRTKKLFVYIAGPYTKGDVAENVRTAILAASTVADLGHIPFVPHLYHFWHLLDPRPYGFWTALDNAWLPKCDLLIRLDGESAGSDAEVALAREHGVGVTTLSSFALFAKGERAYVACGRRR